MPQLPALVPGSRQHASNTLAGQPSPRTGGNAAGLAASPLMQRSAQDVVALSRNGLDLSARGLDQRTDALGNATLDAAQDFLSTMARKMFGDGASIAFDSVDLQAGASFSGAAASVSGAGGSSHAAAFSLDENAHFTGKGKITTADGQSFDFEVEVRYQSNISAGAMQQTPADTPPADGGDAAAMPARQMPAIDFAGGLNDLFKLLGQQLRSSIYSSDGASASSNDGNQAGQLTLRLLKLVQPPRTAQADKQTGTQADQEAQARARALAQAYGAADAPPATTGQSA